MSVFPLRFVALAVVVAVPLGLGGVYAWRMRADPVGQVEALTAKGDWRQAQIVLRTQLAKTPDDPALHLRMARLQSRLADPVAAEKEYRRAVALGADSAAIMPEWGETLLLQGRSADVLRMVPARGATPSLAARNLLLRAIAQLALNDAAAAEGTYRLAVAQAPDQAETMLIGARLAAARNDAPAVEAAVAKVLAKDPDQVEALLMQGQLLAAKGDRAGALAVDNRAVAAAPWSAMARIDRAYQSMFMGQDAAAQADVDAVLANQPLFIDAVYLSGVLMARRGQYAQASDQLSRLDNAGPRFPQVLFYRAKVAQMLKQPETAADFARRYGQLVPEDPDGIRLRAETALAIGRAADEVGPVERLVRAGPPELGTLLLLSRLQAATGNRAGAVAALQQARSIAGSSAEQQGELGIALLHNGQARDALSLLQPAAAALPTSVPVAEARAEALIQTGDTAAAAMAVQRLRELAPDGAEVGNLAGLLALQQGDAKAAQAAWVAALVKSPDSVPARFNLVRLLVMGGRTKEAADQLRRILSQQPANLVALRSYLELVGNDQAAILPVLEAAQAADKANPLFAALLADGWTADGRAAAALKMLAAVPASAGSRGLLLPPTARAQAAAGQAAAAIRTYGEALEINPQDGVSRAALVQLVARSEGADAGIALMRQGVAAAPGQLPPMTALVRAVRAEKGMDAALAEAERLRAVPGNMPVAAALRGDLLAGEGQQAAAAAAFKAEYDAQPSLALLLRLAAADSAAGGGDVAAAALRGWLARNPGSVLAAQTLAKLDIRAGRLAEAATQLTGVLAQQPKDVEALNNLAGVYAQMNDPRALPTAQAAYLNGPSAMTADTLGWILHGGGQSRQALQLLSTAAADAPGDPAVQYHYAAVLAASGQAEEAGQVLRATLAMPAAFAERGAAEALAERLRRP